MLASGIPPGVERTVPLDELRIGELLAEGGEGRVFELPLQPHLVMKAFRRPAPAGIPRRPGGLAGRARRCGLAARVRAAAAWPAARWWTAARSWPVRAAGPAAGAGVLLPRPRAASPCAIATAPPAWPP